MAPLKLMPRLVRIPDVSFISWDQLPAHEYPNDPIPELHPDIAVEVLSEGNTEEEMRRKVKEYFFAGTRLVWLRRSRHADSPGLHVPRRIGRGEREPDRSTAAMCCQGSPCPWGNCSPRSLAPTSPAGSQQGQSGKKRRRA